MYQLLQNAPPWFATVLTDIKEIADQVKIRLISQLISGISGVPQKVLRYLMVLLFHHYRVVLSLPPKTKKLIKS